MSTVNEAQNLMREAWPLSRYGSVKAILYECQRFMSRRTEREFTQRRARTIWEGRTTRIYSDEMDALRAAKIEEMKHEQVTLRARLDQIDQALAGWRADVGRGTAPEERP